MQKNANVVSIDAYEDVPANDEKSLQKAVAGQPVSVAMEGGGRDFQLYESVSLFDFLPFNSDSRSMLTLSCNHCIDQKL